MCDRNFSRLVSTQLSNHCRAVYCCKKCFHAYSSSKLLEKHSVDCCHVQRFEFPKDPRCKFTNIKKQLPTPFVVYADFESVLQLLSNVDTTQGVTVSGETSITHYQEHVACSYSYKIVSSVIPDFNKPIVWYRRPNAAEKLIYELQREAEKLCVEYIYTHQEMKFTGDDEVCFESAHVCHMCQRILVDDGDRVRDHCHFTGTYRDAAHNACNINYHI